MTLVRILVDGCGLLHQWTEIAPGTSRLSKAAREALIHQLARFSVASGLPVSVVFEGTAQDDNAAPNHRDVDIFYGRPRQRRLADMAGDPVNRGGFRVVTDDPALRDTIFALGGSVLSTHSFIAGFYQALAHIESSIRQFKRTQRRPHSRRL